VRPKKARPDARGLLLKERPFSYRARKDGTVEISYKRRPVTTLAGKLAENFVAATEESSADELQFLMAKATGNFKRGNERRR
jgi:hypothetical protein